MMGVQSPDRDALANLADVLRRSLSLKKREHVARLVQLPEPFLNELSPDRPAPITKVLKGYNESVAEELASYAQCLKQEVLRVVNKVDGKVTKTDVKTTVLDVSGYSA